MSSDREQQDAPAGVRGRRAVDPIALLKREHEIILDQLRRIDRVVGPGTAKGPVQGRRRFGRPERAALQELFGFFMDRMEVHFEREGILIEALARILGPRQARREGLEELEREHESLQTETTRITRLLGDAHGGRTVTRGADPADIRHFVHHYGWHLYWEERILFVLAEARLTSTQKLKVGCSILQV